MLSNTIYSPVIFLKEITCPGQSGSCFCCTLDINYYYLYLTELYSWLVIVILTPLIIFRPDITKMVDWALKTNYLPTIYYYHIVTACYAWIYPMCCKIFVGIN